MSAGNVLKFDQARRSSEIANTRAVDAAIDQVTQLIKLHGCRWFHCACTAPDGTRFQVFSHEDEEPGMNFFIVPPNSKQI